MSTPTLESRSKRMRAAAGEFQYLAQADVTQTDRTKFELLCLRHLLRSSRRKDDGRTRQRMPWWVQVAGYTDL